MTPCTETHDVPRTPPKVHDTAQCKITTLDYICSSSLTFECTFSLRLLTPVRRSVRGLETTKEARQYIQINACRCLLLEHGSKTLSTTGNLLLRIRKRCRVIQSIDASRSTLHNTNSISFSLCFTCNCFENSPITDTIEAALHCETLWNGRLASYSICAFIANGLRILD